MKNSNMYLSRRWYGISRKWFENDSVMVRERVGNVRYFAALLTLLFTLGVGNAWGVTATYTLNTSHNNSTQTVDYTSWNIGASAIGTNDRKTMTKLQGTITVTLPTNAQLNSVTINKGGSWGGSARVSFKSGSTTLNTFSTNGTFNLTTNKTNLTYTFQYSGSGNAWVSSIIVSYEIVAPSKYNVTLSRNGVTETITDVTDGTDLDDIDGSGTQGGCAAWEFIGWSKTQRTVQNNTAVITLVTEVDDAGPYYAVYRHTESGGGSTNVEFNFGYSDWGKNAQFYGNYYDEVSQNDGGIYVTYTRHSGSLYANTTSLRFYKSNTLTFDAGSTTITSVTFTGSIGQSDITTDVGTCTNTSESLSWSGSETSVTFTRPSNASSYATFTSAIVTITGGDTYYYSTTASCAACAADPTIGTAQLKGSFSLSNFWRSCRF